MQEQLEALLRLIGDVPVEIVYLLVGAGAAIENLFPPVPSDLVVVAGGILADRGMLDVRLVFLVAWASNLLLALGVYVAARHFGGGIFSTRWGRWLLRPAQLERMSLFYEDYGALTILVSRFFPVFRVLVPAFAGISRLGFARTALPLAVASAIWYAVLVVGGVLASRNIPRIMSALTAVNTTVGLIALAVALALAWLWWRSRHFEESKAPRDE
ncbi:MAG: DedA family protein [Gemmatimonadetes bacterium]|nr:DedA family protein [Gemmatimonadota bacterium]